MKIALPIVFLVFFLVVTVWPVWRVRRATGINPIRTRNEKSVHSYVTGLIRWLWAIPLVAVLAFCFGGDAYQYLLPIPHLGSRTLALIGFSLIAFSLVWTSAAQFRMGKSWRIGIDDENPTALVSGGLFTISRNPIYLGLMVGLLGLFLVISNALTLLCLVTTWFVVSIQIRLEEDFLAARHGAAYRDYMARVRRWL